MAALVLARGPARAPVLVDARGAVIPVQALVRGAEELAPGHAKILAKEDARAAALDVLILALGTAMVVALDVAQGALIVAVETAILGAVAAALDVHTVAVAAGLDAVIVAQVAEEDARERAAKRAEMDALDCVR